MTHPDEEMSAMKELKNHINMVGCVADAQYGIPTVCPCGGSIINEGGANLRFPTDVDTLPGRKYFTCEDFVDDGLHFRQPWVFGIEEEIHKLMRRVQEMEAEITELKTTILLLKRP